MPKKKDKARSTLNRRSKNSLLKNLFSKISRRKSEHAWLLIFKIPIKVQNSHQTKKHWSQNLFSRRSFVSQLVQESWIKSKQQTTIDQNLNELHEKQANPYHDRVDAT